jgi:ABC-2 type transport system permease protein
MTAAPSAVRAFVALTWLTLRRQWRVRALGWATFGLVALITLSVALITTGRNGWGFDTRWSGRYRTLYRDYPQQLDRLQMLPSSGPGLGIEAAVFGPFRAMLRNPQFLADFAFQNFSRWVVFGLFLGFLLPMVNLAFASGAIGGEREGRTLIWLFTRPQPRAAMYVAKFLGVLPWCVLVSLAGLAAVCAAGGPVGRQAFVAFAPDIALGSVAFAALFHLLGAVVKRPAVIGLAYVFFFETLVANLPGSLKQLSLNYYVRSALFDAAASRVVSLKPESLDVYAPAEGPTARLTLVIAAVVVTALGAFLFGRAEPSEET